MKVKKKVEAEVVQILMKMRRAKLSLRHPLKLVSIIIIVVPLAESFHILNVLFLTNSSHSCLLFSCAVLFPFSEQHNDNLFEFCTLPFIITVLQQLVLSISFMTELTGFAWYTRLC